MRIGSNLISYAIAVGYAGYVLKQARFFGWLDITVLLCASVIFLQVIRSRIKFNRSNFDPFLILLLLVCLGGCIGSINRATLFSDVGVLSSESFIAIIYCLFLTYVVNDSYDARQIADKVVKIGLVIVAINAIHLVTFGVPPGGFEGISGNPNQIASYLVYLYAISHLISDHQGTSVKLLLIVGVGVAITLAARSDSASLFFMSIAPMSLLLRHNGMTRTMLSPRAAFAVLICIAIAIVLVVTNTEQILGAIEKIGWNRFVLWETYIGLVGDTYGVGLGPGKYGSSFAATYGIQEAHNTYLDIAVNYSIITVLFTTLFLAQIGRRLWLYDARRLVVFLGVIAMSIFMNCYRHPLFWFYILLAYQYGKQFSLDRRLAFNEKPSRSTYSLKS